MLDVWAYLDYTNVRFRESEIQEMQKKYQELVIFAGMCSDLIKTVGIDEVSNIFINQIKRVVPFRKCSFIRKDIRNDTYALYSCERGRTEKKILLKDELDKNSLIMFCRTAYHYQHDGGFIGVPIKYEGENLGAILLEGIEDICKINNYAILVKMFSIPMGIAIKNCIFSEQLKIQKSTVENQNKAMEREMILGQKLQKCFLPKNKLIFDNYELFSRYIPSMYLSGDCYDALHISEDKVLIYIADVSGHGVASAMLTSFLKHNIKIIEEKYVSRNERINPSKILKDLYKKYYELELDIELYITMFLGILDTEENSFCYSNAGHNVEPILYEKGRCAVLTANGLPLCGILPPDKVDYEEYCTYIKKDAELFLMTDGLIEAVNGIGEYYGNERLKEKLQREYISVEKKISDLIDDVKRFTGNTDFRDDIAILAIRRGK